MLLRATTVQQEVDKEIEQMLLNIATCIKVVLLYLECFKMLYTLGIC